MLLINLNKLITTQLNAERGFTKERLSMTEMYICRPVTWRRVYGKGVSSAFRESLSFDGAYKKMDVIYIEIVHIHFTDFLICDTDLSER